MDKTDLIIAAAGDGKFEEVARLLDEDSSLANASNMFGAQPIHAAYFRGQFQVVDLLVARGVHLDAFLAADLGLVEQVEAAVNANPQFPNLFGPTGSTALHRACYWGQIAVARLLLDCGADPNLETRDQFLGIRPLGCAVASPDIPNPSEREDVVLGLVQLLVTRGAEVNGRRRDGLTALHGAAWRGHTSVVVWLLEHGADQEIRGTEGSGPHAGQTAFEIAVAQGQLTTANVLGNTARSIDGTDAV